MVVETQEHKRCENLANNYQDSPSTAHHGQSIIKNCESIKTTKAQRTKTLRSQSNCQHTNTSTRNSLRLLTLLLIFSLSPSTLCQSLLPIATYRGSNYFSGTVAEVDINFGGKILVFTFAKNVGGTVDLHTGYYDNPNSHEANTLPNSPTRLNWVDSYPCFEKILIATDTGLIIEKISLNADPNIMPSVNPNNLTSTSEVYYAEIIAPDTGVTATPSHGLGLNSSELFKVDLLSYEPIAKYTLLAADLPSTGRALAGSRYDKYFLLNPESRVLRFLDPTTLASLGSFTVPSIPNYKLTEMLVDNIQANPYIYFLFTDEVNQVSRIARYKIDSVGNSLSEEIVIDPQTLLRSVRNVGTLNFLAFSSPKKFLFMSKNGFIGGVFNFVQSMLGSVSPSTFSVTSTTESGYIGYWILNPDSSTSQNSMKVEFGTCTAFKDPITNVVIGCTKGCFLNSDFNTCLDPATLNGSGLNPASSIIYGCKQGCLACNLDQEHCTLCSTQPDDPNVVAKPCSKAYMLYPVDRTCWCLDNPPTGYGIKVVSGIETGVPCDSSLNCVTCPKNYLSCETCSSNFGLYEYSTAVTPSLKKCVYKVENIAANKGIGIVDAIKMNNCLASANCLTCLQDYTKCETCDSGIGLYLYEVDFTCKPIGGNLGPYRKPVTGLIVVKNCDPTKNCLTCEDDYSKCKTCSASNYLDPVSFACVGSIPAGYTADSLRVLVPCSAKNCQTCLFSDLSKCTTCLTSTSYVYDADGSCYETNPWLTTMQNGFGLKPSGATKVITKCDSTLNCLNCNPNYLSCDTCLTDYMRYEYSVGNFKCIYAKEEDYRNYGYGKDTLASGILKLCSTPANNDKCISCIDDYKKCSRCNSALGYYVSNIDYSCQFLGGSFGRSNDTITGWSTLYNCADPKCQACVYDYNQCSSCASPRMLYTDPRTFKTTCIDTTSGVNENFGKGIDTSLGNVVRDCDVDAYCRTCLADYKKCDSCPTPLTLNTTTFKCEVVINNTTIPINNTKCLNPTEIPPPIGEGYDPALGKYVKCDFRSNCLRCEDNYKKCTACAQGFVLENSICKAVVIQSAVSTQGEVTLVFDIDVTPFNPNDLEYTVYDSLTQKMIICPPSQCRGYFTDNNPKAMKFELKPTSSVLRGRVYAQRKLSSQAARLRLLATSATTLKDPFANSVEIRDAQFSEVVSQGQKVTPFTGIYIAFATMRLVFSYFLGALGSPRTFFGTEIFSTLFYFSMIEAPLVGYAERFLADIAHWELLVIKFFNPFERWNEYCYASTHYPKTQLTCNFLANYGQNLLTLILTLMICSVFYIYDVMKRPKQPPPTSDKDEEAAREAAATAAVKARTRTRCHMVAKSIPIELGYSFFFGLMEALKIPILILALQHIRSNFLDTLMIIGLIISIMFIAWYWFACACTSKLSNSINDALSRRGPPRPIIQLSPLKNILKIERMAFGFTRYNYLGILCPLSKWHLLGPFFSYLRAVLISTIIVFFPDNPNAAISFILGVEICTLLFKAITCERLLSIYHHWIEIITGVLIVAYLTFRLFTLSNWVSEEARQKQLSIALLFVLYALLALILIDFIVEILRFFERLPMDKRLSTLLELARDMNFWVIYPGNPNERSYEFITPSTSPVKATDSPQQKEKNWINSSPRSPVPKFNPNQEPEPEHMSKDAWVDKEKGFYVDNIIISKDEPSKNLEIKATPTNKDREEDEVLDENVSLHIREQSFEYHLNLNDLEDQATHAKAAHERKLTKENAHLERSDVSCLAFIRENEEDK
jgi:hypothetical protein